MNDNNLDAQLLELHKAAEEQLWCAHATHRSLCEQEIRVFRNFMHREALGSYTDVFALLKTFAAKRDSVTAQARDIIRKRDEQNFIHERRFNRLELRILEVQKRVLPNAIEAGRCALLRDAVAKLGATLCEPEKTDDRGENVVIKTAGQKAQALGVLYRYPELTEFAISDDGAPTADTEKKRFGYYLLLAEKENVAGFKHLRRHYEVLFAWTWGMTAAAASQEADERPPSRDLRTASAMPVSICSGDDIVRPASVPLPPMAKMTEQRQHDAAALLTRAREPHASPSSAVTSSPSGLLDEAIRGLEHTPKPKVVCMLPQLSHGDYCPKNTASAEACPDSSQASSTKPLTKGAAETPNEYYNRIYNQSYTVSSSADASAGARPSPRSGVRFAWPLEQPTRPPKNSPPPRPVRPIASLEDILPFKPSAPTNFTVVQCPPSTIAEKKGALPSTGPKQNKGTKVRYCNDSALTPSPENAQLKPGIQHHITIPVKEAAAKKSLTARFGFVSKAKRGNVMNA